jgi:hypothetical protein
MGHSVRSHHQSQGGRSMTQHTPGPWRHWGSDIVIKDRDGDDMIICGMGKPASFRSHPYSVPSSRQTKANAQLIAAAPDMLAALQGIMAESSRDDDDHDVIATIQGICRVAMAKAKGGAA